MLQKEKKMGSNGLVFVAFVALALVASGLLSCGERGRSLPVISDVFDPACTNISWTDVVARGRMMVNLSISAAAIANAMTPNVTVSMVNCSFEEGAILLVQGFGGSVSSRPLPIVTVMIEFLSARNGVLMFVGWFPPRTTIVVRNANMTFDNATSARSLSIIPRDKEFPNAAKMLVIANFSIIDGSCFVVQDSSFLGTGADSNGCFLIYFNGLVSLSNSSVLAVKNSNFSHAMLTDASVVGFKSGALKATESSIFLLSSCNSRSESSSIFVILHFNMTFADDSRWDMLSCHYQSLDPSSVIVLQWGSSAFTFQRNSSLLMSSCTFDGSSRALFLFDLVFMLQVSSKWTIEHNSLTGSDAEALFIESSIIVVESKSKLSFSGTNFTSSTWTGVALIDSSIEIRSGSRWTISKSAVRSSSDTSAALMLSSQSVIDISDGSGWVISESSFICINPRLSSPLSPVHIEMSSISLRNGSYWIMSSTYIATFTATAPPIFFDSASELLVGPTSWTMWSKNNMSSIANETCIQLLGLLTIASGSAMSFIENNCTSASRVMSNGTITAKVSGSGEFFQRCNVLNTFLLVVPFLFGLPTTSASPGSCGLCSAAADCFGPLITVGTTCEANASSGAAVCSPCRSGGEGAMCLPSESVAPPPPTTVLHSTGIPAVGLQSTAAPQTTLPETTRALTQMPTTAQLTTLPGSSLQPATTPQGSFVSPTSESSDTDTSSITVTQLSETAPTHFQSVSAADPSASAQTTTFSAAATSSTSITLSFTCPEKHRISDNATMVLVSSGLATAAGSTLSVSAVTQTGEIYVDAYASPGIFFSEATNVTASIGTGWVATLLESSSSPWFLHLQLRGKMTQRSVGLLSLVKRADLFVSVDVHATGFCLPPLHRERLTFGWVLEPLPPPTLVRSATQALFRASTVAGSLLSNPVGSMTTTSMVSMLSLSSCIFSDVDPLETQVSPIPAAAGPELGQYYRGAAVLALGLYSGGVAVFCLAGWLRATIFDAERPISFHLSALHFPSVSMILVGLFSEGLASCAVSLLRLRLTAADIALGCVSLGVCVGIAGWAMFVTTGSRLQVRLAERGGTPLDIFPLRLAQLSFWKYHYVDLPGGHFKRAHMMLIDGLRAPWWTAVELFSATFQGAILGIRENSLTTCRAQQWVLVVESAAIGIGAFCVQPFGDRTSNMFLVSSKLFAFIVALLGLVEALTLDEVYFSIAESVAAVATAFSTIQVVISIWFVFLPLARKILHQVREPTVFQVRGVTVLGTRRIEALRPREVKREDISLAEHTFISGAEQPLIRVPRQREGIDLAGQLHLNRILQNLIEAVNMRKPVSLRLLMLIEAVCESARAPSDLH